MASNHRAGFDAGVIAYTDLSSHDDIIFDGDTAGEAGLGGDNYVFSDLTVVANVDQIVDLCALADSGFIQRAAVDGGVGSDFHVVFDYQAADLRGLLVASCLLLSDVAETFAAENRSGLDDDAVAQGCAGVNGDFGDRFGNGVRLLRCRRSPCQRR